MITVWTHRDRETGEQIATPLPSMADAHIQNAIRMSRKKQAAAAGQVAFWTDCVDSLEHEQRRRSGQLVEQT